MHLTALAHSPSILKFSSVICEPLSYDACAEFAKQFDRLYTGRVKATYPHPNPMRKSNTAFHNQDINEIFGNVQFPTEYWFDQDERGIIDRTSLGFGDGNIDRYKSVYYAFVNPATGLALSVEGTGCDVGKPIKMQQFKSEENRQKMCQE